MKRSSNNSRDDDRDRRRKGRYPQKPTASTPPAKSVLVPSRRRTSPCTPTNGASTAATSVASDLASSPTYTTPQVRRLNDEQCAALGQATKIRFLQHATILGGSMGLSVACFVYIILPFNALCWMLMFIASLGLFILRIQSYVRSEYDRIVAGRGFGEYLPSGLMNTLTEQTVHEFLLDDSFAQENRFMMLYFIPGLDRRQLEGYIDRIAPQHRNMLYRRGGLGHALLGDDIMRMILGNERYEQQAMARPFAVAPPLRIIEDDDISTVEEEEEENRPIRLLMHDDASSSSSSLGLDINEQDMPGGGMTDQQAAQTARALGIDAADIEEEKPSFGDTNTTEAEEVTKVDEAQNEEERAINDAMYDAMLGMFIPNYRSLVSQPGGPSRPEALVTIALSYASRALTVGLSLLSISGGLSLWLSHGHRFFRFGGGGIQSPRMRGFAWTWAILGGAMTGAGLFVQVYLRMGRAPPPTAPPFAPPPPPEPSTPKKKKKL